MARPLGRKFYAGGTLSVARDLLGCVLARKIENGPVLRGRIVETEAYVGEEDRACHARAGRTPRTEVMYGEPGHAYIYFTYGMHYLLNVVTEPEGSPAAVLLRAVEPLEGIEWMARARHLHLTRARARRENGSRPNRGAPSGSQSARHEPPPPHHLASGPGKLCQAFGLDLTQNGADLLGSLLWIEPGEPIPGSAVRTSARIGCQTAAAPWDRIPWRFFVKDSPYVTPGRAPGVAPRAKGSLRKGRRGARPGRRGTRD